MWAVTKSSSTLRVFSHVGISHGGLRRHVTVVGTKFTTRRSTFADFVADAAAQQSQQSKITCHVPIFLTVSICEIWFLTEQSHFSVRLHKESVYVAMSIQR
jgi:hypothetical protein